MMAHDVPSPSDPQVVLPNLIAARAAEIPDQIFLVEIDVESVTYGAFHQRCLLWADALRQAGIGAGDRVAVMLRTTVDEHAIWLACGWLRAIEVPINTAYRGHMLRHVLADSGARLAVTAVEFVEQIDEVRSETDVDRIIVIGAAAPAAAHHLPAERVLAAAEATPIDITLLPSDIAAIVYTSGTTGPSKGVLAPWGQLATGLAAFDDFAEGDVLYAPFAAYHLGGKLPLQLLAYWRGTFVFRDGFRTGAFWDDIRRHGCNRSWLFYAMANFLYQQPERADDLDNPIETVTGGPMMAEHRDFERRFGVRMRTNYGMTEIGWPIATGDDVTDHRSCGTVRAGYDLLVVDADGRPVAVNEVGELLVRSHTPFTMNQGYWGRPDDSAEAWRDGWFHTGDAFRVDELGRWYFVDRVKDAIRRRAENISSFEVESMVTAHPAVLECAAIGVSSADGEEEIKVCVVLQPGVTIEPAALISDLEPTMPRFMVPRFVEFLDELPKTPTSKVRKVLLKDNPVNAATWDRLADSVSRR